MSLLSQETFSKVFDLDEDAFANTSRDLELLDDGFCLSSVQFCKTDTGHIGCSALSTFDWNGNLKDQWVLDTVYSGISRPLSSLPGTDRMFFTGIRQNIELVGRKTHLWEFNQDLEFQGTYSFEGDTDKVVSNYGLYCDENYIYLYGGLVNYEGNPMDAQILKIDANTKEQLWEKRYTVGDFKLEVNGFQATPDGNLAFILWHESQVGSGGERAGRKIYKINPAGDTLNSFHFNDGPQQENRFLIAEDGSYYFPSQANPLDYWDYLTPRINKLSADMDSLEWSVILPNDQLIDGRIYIIEDIIEAEDGDVVACGRVWDNSDSEIPGADKHSTWNGFLIRLNLQGEVEWLRVYRYPNDLYQDDEFGRFRPSTLKEIKAMDDGSFVAAGNVYVNNTQYAGLNELETELYHLWLLRVDENGCLDDYPCEEIIRLKEEIVPLNFQLGNQWIYEREEPYINGDYAIEYSTITLNDSITTNGIKKFPLNIQDTMYEEGSKWFFWDNYYQEYVMHYDFEETNQYQIKYFDPFKNSDEVATVVIDSISYRSFGADSLKVQHVKVINSGTYDDYVVDVYERIGASHYGLKFVLGRGLFDNDPIITKLRCFSSDAMTYNFVSYACDSTWIITGLNELADEKISIYPNPTSGALYIKDLDQEVEYQVFNIVGELTQEGHTSNKSLLIEHNGIFVIKLKIDDQWLSKKVVRIE